MELNGRNIFGQKRLDFMFRLACSILGRSDEAEDMMQDVAERILRREGSLDEVGNIDAFITRSVRNACIDRLRRRKDTTPKIPEVPDEKSPDRWSDRQLVHRAMARLPERPESTEDSSRRSFFSESASVWTCMYIRPER